MVREFLVAIYLTVFRIFFSLFNRFTMKQKTTFIASFGGNIKETIKMMNKLVDDEEIIILKAPECHASFSNDTHMVLNLDLRNGIQFMKSIYHLATSSHVIADNYYGFLTVSNFRPEVKCVQLWHAAGAIKKFGLEDLTNKNRSTKALQRFETVYNRFSHVIVGSEEMVDVFKRSFGLPEDRFIRTGIPRTDFFFNDESMQKAEKRLSNYFPIINDKKMLLYAPTYRDGTLTSTKLEIDLDKMYDQLKYEYVLFLRLHPAVEGQFENKYPGFVFNVSNYPNINDLLVGADILISDYSSIPFEFSLLERPMIFYAYDFYKYAKQRGVWPDYKEKVPGPVVTETNELIEVIRKNKFPVEKILAFQKEWNQYSNGNSTENLVHTLYDTDHIKERRTNP